MGDDEFEQGWNDFTELTYFAAGMFVLGVLVYVFGG
jgi:hypothetical protein